MCTCRGKLILDPEYILHVLPVYALSLMVLVWYKSSFCRTYVDLRLVAKKVSSPNLKLSTENTMVVKEISQLKFWLLRLKVKS